MSRGIGVFLEHIHDVSEIDQLTGLDIIVPRTKLFHVTWNIAISETVVIRELVDLIRARLPEDWHLATSLEQPRGRSRADAILDVRSPDGSSSQVIIEVKSAIMPKDVPAVVRQARALAGNATVLIGAPYLSERTREQLVAASASYADTTGNMRVV